MKKSYQNSFYFSVLFHIVLAGMLLYQSGSNNPVMTPNEQMVLTKPQAPDALETHETIKAISVNSEDVLETIERIKNEREQKKIAEQQRQQAIQKKLQQAKKRRQLEEERLEILKKEQQQLELARKKQIAENKKRERLALQKKKEEEQRLEALKRQKEKIQKEQAQEEKRLAALKKQQEEEQAKALERQKRIEAERALQESKRKEEIAGEVNKYKALIISAISRQWILPDNFDDNLSSQFRIRLAPTGAVLDVSLTRSSGDPILDRSAQSAIYKASPLPVPKEPDAFDMFRDIRLTVRPENARG